MNFKYLDHHRKLNCDCPNLIKCNPVIRTSFRFCHEDLTNPNNFLPPLVIKPSRRTNTCEEACSGYALSFFTSLASAEKKYLKIIDHAPQFAETAGQFIAECDIRENDGMSEGISSAGHFDLHEYQNTSFIGRFKLIKRITL